MQTTHLFFCLFWRNENCCVHHFLSAIIVFQGNSCQVGGIYFGKCQLLVSISPQELLELGKSCFRSYQHGLYLSCFCVCPGLKWEMQWGRHTSASKVKKVEDTVLCTGAADGPHSGDAALPDQWERRRSEPWWGGPSNEAAVTRLTDWRWWYRLYQSAFKQFLCCQ